MSTTTRPDTDPARQAIRAAVTADREAIARLIEESKIKSHVKSVEGDKIDKGVVGAQRILAAKVRDLPPWVGAGAGAGAGEDNNDKASATSATSGRGPGSKGLTPPKGGSGTAPAQAAAVTQPAAS